MSSDKWDIALTKELRKRDNSDPIGPVIGDLISIDPLKIAIYNNQVILTTDHCYMCSSLSIKKENIILDNVADYGSITTSCTVSDILSVGDKLLCIPTADGQKWFIVDKII